MSKFPYPHQLDTPRGRVGVLTEYVMRMGTLGPLPARVFSAVLLWDGACLSVSTLVDWSNDLTLDLVYGVASVSGFVLITKASHSLATHSTSVYGAIALNSAAGLASCVAIPLVGRPLEAAMLRLASVASKGFIGLYASRHFAIHLGDDGLFEVGLDHDEPRMKAAVAIGFDVTVAVVTVLAAVARGCDGSLSTHAIAEAPPPEPVCAQLTYQLCAAFLFFTSTLYLLYPAAVPFDNALGMSRRKWVWALFHAAFGAQALVVVHATSPAEGIKSLSDLGTYSVINLFPVL